jgi:hypothetical protein
MDPLEVADDAVVEHQNSEKGDTCCQDSLQSVGKVPGDILAILADQNASTSVVALAIPCQNVPWTLPNVPLVHFHPSLPSFTCEMHLAGGVEWSVEKWEVVDLSSKAHLGGGVERRGE